MRQLRPPPLPLPLHHPFHLGDILQPPSHLHDPAPHHPRIYSHCLLDELLDGRGGVEAEDEVVAGIVPRLVLLDGFGEEVGAPVCEAAEDAAVGEDEGAGCVGDSRKGRC